MRLRRLGLALVVIVVALFSLMLQARAGGNIPGTLAPCQTIGPSGAPLRVTILDLDKDVQNELAESIALTVDFHGVNLGIFTATNISFAGALSQIEAGCLILTTPTLGSDDDATTSLSDEIVKAAGLRGSTKVTVCSFLGATHPDCKLPADTLHAPAGWPSGQITVYGSP